MLPAAFAAKRSRRLFSEKHGSDRLRSAELRSLGITGGEPTLLGDRLFELLRHVRTKLPETEIHLLTNGRAFADKEYARKLAECGEKKILLGVPLHADSAGDHDTITQVKGSFEETMLGLYNLGRYDIGIELRVVITKMNYRRLPKLPDFIYRNLPFVEFISLMGLEYTGYTIKNREAVWIDPMDYQAELTQAVFGAAGLAYGRLNLQPAAVHSPKSAMALCPQIHIRLENPIPRYLPGMC
ncbi:MAG: radical SAM protein [Alistipes onderdonkii]